MSKSLGNVFLAKDFITEYGPNVLRALMLSTHYSKPMNVTQDLIDMTIKELNK
ncbi:MAG: hypothetical protein DRP42_00315 [Tenericutes bacterium]|nr:MAG: hypothetical protein DRP42_00315 [Mycoplasmatota bacterium]